MAGLSRWPVKGLPPEDLDAFDLAADMPMTGDRAYALVPTDSGVAVDDGRADWAPRRNFLVVARTPALAALRADWDDRRLVLRGPDGAAIQADLAAAADRASLADWLATRVAGPQPGPFEVVAGRTALHDRPVAALSVLSTDSLAALEGTVGGGLDRRRFRGNLWIAGGGPWAEDDLVGRRFRAGGVVFDGLERIERCRAVDADPDSGARDSDLCRALHGLKGAPTFGLLARVVDGGRVSVGDTWDSSD